MQELDGSRQVPGLEVFDSIFTLPDRPASQQYALGSVSEKLRSELEADAGVSCDGVSVYLMVTGT